MFTPKKMKPSNEWVLDHNISTLNSIRGFNPSIRSKSSAWIPVTSSSVLAWVIPQLHTLIPHSSLSILHSSLYTLPYSLPATRDMTRPARSAKTNGNAAKPKRADESTSDRSTHSPSDSDVIGE